MKRKIFVSAFLVLLSSLFSTNLFAEDSLQKQKLTLKKENARFSAVLTGKAICQPEETSYGFCLITDAKLITAISNSGKTLWERSIQGIPEPYLTVMSGDFILTVSGKRIISLINPSGSLVWKKVLDFDLTDKPVCGRDGRIFVRGKNRMACLGINGIQKWDIETPEQSKIPIKEFNDGTLLVLLNQEENGKSKGLRISPFGEIIVTITFSAKIIQAESSVHGIILSFADGSIGLCYIDENSTITKWAVSSKSGLLYGSHANSGTSIVVTGENTACLLISGENKTNMLFFKIATGEIMGFFETTEVDISRKTFAARVQGENAVFFSDSQNAVIYNSEGKLLYTVQLQENQKRKTWNYICFSNSNHLLLCETSWLFLGWKTYQKIGGKSYTPKPLNYSDFYFPSAFANAFQDETGSKLKIDKKIADPARTHLLQEGNYGVVEQDWISIILCAYTSYYNSIIKQAARGTRFSTSLFEKDAEGTELLITQLSLFGTTDFPYQCSLLLGNSKDPHVITILLRAIKNCGYDPKAELLNALDKLLMKLSVSSSAQLIELCDAVYEICRFMGRPALYSHGKEMLTTLLYPKYSSQVREKARNTLVKIRNLNSQ